MKCTVHIDPAHEEEVVVFAHERNRTVEEIERIATTSESKIIGYQGEQFRPLDPREISCILIEDQKTYAITRDGRYLLKMRLFELEEILPERFIKINKSALANLDAVTSFGVSAGGALTVHFRGGHTDYVSRRQVAAVKEKLGL